MKNVEIPRKEKKTKRLFIPVTPTEHQKIILYCHSQQVTLSELIRFAIKETFDL
ncbi:MAG: hypothetical protein HN778_17245 [Prolixibacteraceae bacterium]|jgi:hypothetical protein|nr:hypothetical protein [Prolixibacteraceae bacterium]MBT6004307.1 hypothetical protein [Prolixibacteraceae bacterium]MBT6765108.1 hypothetical protein [Prolixibacteraceae bacterium]MBT6999881.1 hypothetical protein [Prolixibacteraceae bacterium]MBT7396576.1 hypothetical protein [Prolixibacteraceae bacterium]